MLVAHAIFQSTLPARGATRRHRRHIATYTISIHAPRTGSDGADVRRGGQGQHFNPRSPHGERPLTQAIPRRMQRDFNPRSPHGERLRLGGRRGGGGHFNPRSPHGERLRGRDAPTRAVVISIHAPRTGSDGQPRKQMHRACIFQSTLPARGATARCFALSVIQSNFNPRSPHGERRSATKRRQRLHKNFNPRSPHGERHVDKLEFRVIRAFQSTLPARGATRSPVRQCYVSSDFNPRSPHGERHCAAPFIA